MTYTTNIRLGDDLADAIKAYAKANGGISIADAIRILLTQALKESTIMTPAARFHRSPHRSPAWPASPSAYPRDTPSGGSSWASCCPSSAVVVIICARPTHEVQVRRAAARLAAENEAREHRLDSA